MNREVVTVLTDEGIALLKTKSEPVSFTVLGDGTLCLDQDTNELIEDLKRFVVEQHGLGMSAVQLGVLKRIFVMRKPWTSSELVVVVNPKLGDQTTDCVPKIESCFSIPLPPGAGVYVARSSKIEVEYETQTGEHVSEILTSMQARIFQHEMDHLEGKLMIDKNRFGGWSVL